VGFTNLGIPAGGLFAGAEAIKTPEQEATYGGAAGEQLDPCYHLFCDTLESILGAPPADALFDPADAAKMQGGGLKSLRQFLPAMTHGIWYFAKAKNPLPARTTASAKVRRERAARMTKLSQQFKYRGHELAQPR